MPTYRLDIEYDGGRYHGWQEQKNARTVAGELRRAIESAGGEIVELSGAGRTDAGVHALVQTARVRLRRSLEPRMLHAAVNDGLPSDIHLLGVLAATSTFHPRHDAVSRSYLYQISRRRTGLAKRHVWWVRQPLDETRLAAAAARIEGRHDFVLFCERPAEQGSTIVVVERVSVATAGDLVLLRLVASHFLWKMVRRLVGTLVQVASGQLEIEELAALLAARPPARGRSGPAQWTAPAAGLFLERVLYPGEPSLPPLAPVSSVPAHPDASGAWFVGRRAGPSRRR